MYCYSFRKYVLTDDHGYITFVASRYYSPFLFHCLLLDITYERMFTISATTGGNSGAKTIYPFGAIKFTPVWVTSHCSIFTFIGSVLRTTARLFVHLSINYFIFCPSIYSFKPFVRLYTLHISL